MPSSTSQNLLLLPLTVLTAYYYYSTPCHGWSEFRPGTFGFDVHHLLSEPVKALLGVGGSFPEEGTAEYYSLLAHRDRLMIQGRRLSSADQAATLTFAGGNTTYRIDALGYLHYANITVGNPSLSFLVALDTGSDLLWLPCDCIQCVQGLGTPGGEEVFFNIYSPNASSTSSIVSCKSSYCGKQQQSSCSAAQDYCNYQINYLSNGTSSSGILVEDMLHLTAEDNRLKSVNARVTFGCGRIQTGTFLNGGAPNGLMGLGMNNISIPSKLAEEGLTSSSFSMCFGLKGIGRILFGDQGTSNQGETPFSISQLHPAYNITVTQLVLGSKIHDVEFSAIFDSGTSFTLLSDPAYSLLTESFDTLVQEKRHPPSPDIPFEYCYELRTNISSLDSKTLNLTMKGGNTFHVNKPLVLVVGNVYCLAVLKSPNINIIGQNFMTGYRVVFDRERMVLGWKASNCYEADAMTTLPVNPRNSSVIAPSATLNPEATSQPGSNSSLASAPTLLMSDMPWCLNLYICSFVFILVTYLPIL